MIELEDTFELAKLEKGYEFYSKALLRKNRKKFRSSFKRMKTET